MSLKKKILLFILAVFIAIQFIQPAHNTNAQLLATDITHTYRIPENVQMIFRKSCYDCHSNNTRYPWYVYIQPIGWFMARHIKKGKTNLNFSEFGTYSKRKQFNKLRAIETSIKEGTMPLTSYTLIHKDAKVTSGDKAVVNFWIRKTKDSLSINN